MPKRIKTEELAHDELDSPPRVTNDEDEEIHGDQQETSQVRGNVVKVPSPNASTDEEAVEHLDPQLISAEVRSAIEAATKSTQRESLLICLANDSGLF